MHFSCFSQEVFVRMLDNLSTRFGKQIAGCEFEAPTIL